MHLSTGEHRFTACSTPYYASINEWNTILVNPCGKWWSSVRWQCSENTDCFSTDRTELRQADGADEAECQLRRSDCGWQARTINQSSVVGDESGSHYYQWSEVCERFFTCLLANRRATGEYPLQLTKWKDAALQWTMRRKIRGGTQYVCISAATMCAYVCVFFYWVWLVGQSVSW